MNLINWRKNKRNFHCPTIKIYELQWSSRKRRNRKLKKTWCCKIIILDNTSKTVNLIKNRSGCNRTCSPAYTGASMRASRTPSWKWKVLMIELQKLTVKRSMSAFSWMLMHTRTKWLKTWSFKRKFCTRVFRLIPNWRIIQCFWKLKMAFNNLTLIMRLTDSRSKLT